MQKIVKNEPDFFKKAKEKISNPAEYRSWENKNITNIKPKLKEYIVHEQKNLCAYCERKLENIEELSIDHFKKRKLFPELTLDFYNLFVSCNNPYHCENFKDNKKLSKNDYEKIIHPSLEDPEEYLEYNLTGEIVPRENLDPLKREKALFTIEVFNLNDRGLIEDRKKIISIIILNFLNYFNSWEEVKDNGFDFYFSLLRWIFFHKNELIGLKL